jgi:DNA-binding beta-propeller fold protein YncE
MENVKELSRHPSPGARPQPLAFHRNVLWVGAWDTDHLYAIDPQTWKVIEEVPAPGKPFGIAALGDDLRVVVSIGADDDRFFYRFTPGTGFDESSKTPCPDFTGSHLTSDGTTLYMTQMHFQRILAFDANGSVLREIALPSRCGGIGVGSGAFYMITADEEFDHLELATLDVTSSTPAAVPVAELPPEARALAFDGNAWWTSHREVNEIVSFRL